MPTNTSDLRAKLERKAKSMGIDLLGVADITSLLDFLRSRDGGEFLGAFPRAISIGARFPNAVIDPLAPHNSLVAQWTYRLGVLGVMGNTLDLAAMALAKAIEDAGYSGYPIYPDRFTGRDGFWAYPLKMTGYLAGLGWLGKNALLVNPKFGPRFRLSAVLTDAPLTPDTPLPVRCGTCQDCIDMCPCKALSVGVAFDPNRPREQWAHAEICQEYVTQRGQNLLFPDKKASCALCVYVCPFGKTKKRAKPKET